MTIKQTSQKVSVIFLQILNQYRSVIRMAKLYFYYGAMNSSKTANALMTDFNYRK